MAKLLYITAHPLDELVSNSMAAGKLSSNLIKTITQMMKLNISTYSLKISLILIKMY